ncbi:MAG: hypothetical protein KJZ86_12200 [Caldilineaceae bacterium]|nr:hypothetical protein [Caldilineaceae bacterium]HRJ41453.1 hypothetical protein [Caldilineaceae bacterium]
MPATKTAVSIDNTLFEKAEQIAAELDLSRSGLYALAIGEFVGRYETRSIQQQINAVLADVDDEEDMRFLKAARNHLGTLLPTEW